MKEKRKEKYQKPSIKVRDFKVELLFFQRDFNTKDLMRNGSLAQIPSGF